MNKIKDKIVNFIFKFPKITLLISSLVFILTATPIIKLQSDYTFKVWYNEGDPLVKLYDSFESYFGNDDTLIVLTEHENGILNNEDLKYLEDLSKTLWQVRDVIRVDSITNYDFITLENDEITIKNPSTQGLEPKWLEDQIKANPKLKGYLVDNDLKTSVLMVQIKPGFEKAVEYTAIYNSAKERVESLKKPDSIKIHFMGTVPLSHFFNDAAIKDMEVLIPALYLIVFLLLFFLYRRFSAVFLTFLILSMSMISMLGLMALFGYKINNLSSSAPTILLTISIADILHILTTYYVALGKEKNSLKALDYSLRKNFFPTILTSLTTAIGFYSFSTAYIVPISELGFIVGHGVFLSWFFTYMFLGPILILSSRKPKKENQYNEDKVKEEKEVKIVSFNYEPLMNFLRKNKRSGSLVVVSLLIFFSYLTSKVEIDVDPFAQFKDNHEIVKSQKKFEEKLHWSSTLEILLDAGESGTVKDPLFLSKVDQFTTWLESQSYIHKTISILDTLKVLNKTLHENDEHFNKIPESVEEVSQYLLLYSMGLPPGKNINNYISVHEDKTRLTCMWDIHTSQESLAKIKTIEQTAKSMGLNAKVTGKVPMFHELTPYIVKAFYTSLIFTLIGIALTLMISLRSVGLGLLALIPNIFPLVIGLGVFHLFGFKADIATVLVSSICLGVAVDDTIHFLFEFKRFTSMGQSCHEAILNVSRSSFASLFNTSLILVLGFSSFFFGTYQPVALFGILSAFIILLALLADFFVTPIILYLIYDKDS